ncbi:MAG: Bifunctional protein FolD protein [Parcubacteria group bacterium ADurb.Bin326]|nr:MAG: Bifunctional protein FolD protein [Parcubacteria group bacterium ADurb.Bin326]
MSKAKAVMLDGKSLAEKIKLELKKEIADSGLNLGLAAILVGDNEASRLYVDLKEKACKEVGITFSKYLCNSECYDDIDETELLEMIDFLNRDKQINGVLVQLPLPEGFDADKVIKKIDPAKDVDGFNNGNVTPPTIAAIIELIKSAGENLSDKNAIIIGNSDIFIDNLENHLAKLGIKEIKKEKNIPTNCANYDVIIIVLGQARILKKENIKDGAIIIDVGINKLNGATVGDVDPEVAERAGFLSPVPGGVGPLTVACLLRNVLELTKKS